MAEKASATNATSVDMDVEPTEAMSAAAKPKRSVKCSIRFVFAMFCYT